MNSFGFIMTRHVNSIQTNKMWIHNVSLLTKFYPNTPIVIIDDFSNPEYLTKIQNPKINITIINNLPQFKGAGELLPYIYYLRYKWFASALIIHDSTFIHTRINFSRIKTDVLPLWHYKILREDVANAMQLSRHLTNNKELLNSLENTQFNTPLINVNNKAPNTIDESKLCFGVQAFIRLPFLQKIEEKYHISNLTSFVKSRHDRCILERVFGEIFRMEMKNANPNAIRYSLLGNVYTHYNAFKYTFIDYENDMKNKRIRHLIVKVWSGR